MNIFLLATGTDRLSGEDFFFFFLSFFSFYISFPWLKGKHLSKGLGVRNHNTRAAVLLTHSATMDKRPCPQGP